LTGVAGRGEIGQSLKRAKRAKREKRD